MILLLRIHSFSSAPHQTVEKSGRGKSTRCNRFAHSVFSFVLQGSLRNRCPADVHSATLKPLDVSWFLYIAKQHRVLSMMSDSLLDELIIYNWLYIRRFDISDMLVSWICPTPTNILWLAYRGIIILELVSGGSGFGRTCRPRSISGCLSLHRGVTLRSCPLDFSGVQSCSGCLPQEFRRSWWYLGATVRSGPWFYDCVVAPVVASRIRFLLRSQTCCQPENIWAANSRTGQHRYFLYL